VNTASSQPCKHSHTEGDSSHAHTQEQIDIEYEDVLLFLEEQFGDVIGDVKEKKATISMDGSSAIVDCIKYVSMNQCSGATLLLTLLFSLSRRLNQKILISKNG
jgi:hypothetical protein